MKTNYFTKSFLLILGFLLIFDQTVISQTTFKKDFEFFGHASGNSVVQSEDGGYIIAGYSADENYSDQLTIIKTDSQGDTLWTKQYGEGQFNNIIKSSDNNYIASGSTTIKLDQFGNIIWQLHLSSKDLLELPSGNLGILRSYSYLELSNDGQDTIHNKALSGDLRTILSDENDNIFIGGSKTNAFGSPFNELYVLKLNSDREIVWENHLDEQLYRVACDMILTSSGELAITGGVTEIYGISDIFILKMSLEGSIQWTKNISCGETNVDGCSLIETSDESLYVAGTYCSTLDDRTDLAIIKTDNEGNTDWIRTYYNALDGCGNDLDLIDNEYLSVTGYVVLPGTEFKRRLALLKTDLDGTIVSIDQVQETTEYLKVYPNPGTETIGIDTGLKEFTFTLYSLKSVKLLECKNQYSINTSTLKAGVYFYKITQDDKILTTGKWVKKI